MTHMVNVTLPGGSMAPPGVRASPDWMVGVGRGVVAAGVPVEGRVGVPEDWALQPVIMIRHNPRQTRDTGDIGTPSK